MIRMDGTKMSKSKGNLIAPEHYFDTVGADALRLFHLFVGPPASTTWTGPSRPSRSSTGVAASSTGCGALWPGTSAEGGALRQRQHGTPSAAPHADVWNEALDALLLLLAVMSPHVTAELWEQRHPGEPSVHLQPGLPSTPSSSARTP
jgi:leucyl-tRNA synthetase